MQPINVPTIRSRLARAALLACVLASCAARVEPEALVPGNTAAEADGTYRIGASDLLDILVWKEPDVSGAVRVRPDGMITLPLTGDVAAAGLTTGDLASHLRERLATFIDAPNVAVRVAEMNSRRFYVIGNVKSPGMYELRAGQTVVQAVAVAGGFTEFARRGSVRVLRQQDASTKILVGDYDAIIAGRSADLPLRPGDTVVVP